MSVRSSDPSFTRAGQGLAVLALSVVLGCSSDEEPSTSAASIQPAPAAGDAGSAPGDAPSNTPPAGAAPGTGTSTPEGNGAAEGAPIDDGAEPPPAGPAAGPADSGVAAENPDLACDPALTAANKATVTTAITELFIQGDIGAADRYWADPYLQHNPGAASGVATFRMLFGGLVSPGNPIYELERVVGDCALVLIHGNYLGFGGATFDLFRLDGGRIVEHWDAAALGAGPNPSGHTALDGPTQVADLELGAQNKSLVLQFVTSVLIGQDTASFGTFISPDLIEHNPQSSDGAAAYQQYLQQNAITYRQVHHTIGDGNFVFTLSEGAVGTTDVAHYDLFRIDGGLIVEHWDGRLTVPPTTASGLGIF